MSPNFLANVKTSTHMHLHSEVKQSPTISLDEEVSPFPGQLFSKNSEIKTLFVYIPRSRLSSFGNQEIKRFSLLNQDITIDAEPLKNKKR